MSGFSKIRVPAIIIRIFYANEHARCKTPHMGNLFLFRLYIPKMCNLLLVSVA